MRATTSGSAGAEGDTSPLMPHTTGKRYAVVSCHVERPLDDEVWARFSELQRRRPGGFRIVALMRPADEEAGEDEERWLDRAREAAEQGPLGHHTHWTGPTHARPTGAGAGAKVLAEGRRIRELGVTPTLFCGGGWYTDVEVAEACVELEYVDCTPRASRPPYLAADEPWAWLESPGRIRLPSGQLVAAIPTTHSLGALGRALILPALSDFVHVYFHDTDLVDSRRRLVLSAVLRGLALRARPADPETLARATDGAVEIAWVDVARL
jgi:hypothetical protein